MSLHQEIWMERENRSVFREKILVLARRHAMNAMVAPVLNSMLVAMRIINVEHTREVLPICVVFAVMTSGKVVFDHVSQNQKNQNLHKKSQNPNQRMSRIPMLPPPKQS